MSTIDTNGSEQSTTSKPKSGDVCPQCGKAWLRSRTGKPVANWWEQRLECTSCDFKAKALVPLDRVRRRRHRDEEL